MKYVKNHIIICVLVLIFAVCTASCGKVPQFQQLKNIGGVDFSTGTVIYSIDTHGGFHGDGYTLIQVQCSRKNVEKQLDGLDRWHTLPLSDELNTFVYQPVDSEIEIPIIKNGYFYFYDRHSKADAPYSDIGLLKRASFNFTFAIFDSESEILYYCEYDT